MSKPKVKAGRYPKSPKLREQMKRDAEKNDKKAKPTFCTAKNMKELLKS